MSSSSQAYVQEKRPAVASIAGSLLIIAGVFGLANSALILYSPIILGWFVAGAIGFFSIATGFGVLTGAQWAWSGATMSAIVNIFVGFIAMLGALNPYFLITGLTIYGEIFGACILGLSIVSIILLYRPSVKKYYKYWDYSH